MLTLVPMGVADLEAVEGWLGQPHVARWYLAGSTIEDEIEDLRGSVTGTEPTKVFVVEVDTEPVGWCQWYRCGDYPGHAAGTGASAGDVGIDYAIGEPTLVGKGLGTALVAALVRDARTTHPHAAIIADPDADNLGSRRVLEKNGFELVDERPVSSERSVAPVAIYRLPPSIADGHDH